MMNKIKKALLFPILISLMTACCPVETIEIFITDMETRALILDGINYVEFDQENPIDKEDLIIEVAFIEDEFIVSNTPLQKSTEDLEVLEAAVVPCGEDELVFKSSIESLRVEVLDPDNENVRTDITNQLVMQGESQQSIPDYISENNPGIRNLLFELSDTSNIPNRIIYDVEVTLDDGLQLNSSGGIISFN